MKIKLLFIAASCLLATQLHAQDNHYKTTFDNEGNKVLTGQIDEKILANDSSFIWFFIGVNNYKPNAQLEKYLTAYKDSFKVVAFAGTWCPDAKKLLPEFYKVMLSAGVPQSRITLYGVDHNLKTLDNETEMFHITKVPTFIILNNQGQEAGRIEEHVKTSMEADIISILDKMMADLQNKQRT